MPSGPDLLNLGLIEKELSGDQVMAVLGFAERYLRPGRADLFALVLALELKAILLTGDGALREAAREQGPGGTWNYMGPSTRWSIRD